MTEPMIIAKEKYKEIVLEYNKSRGHWDLVLLKYDVRGLERFYAVKVSESIAEKLRNEIKRTDGNSLKERL